MSSRRNKQYFFRFRSPEGLERRDLLSGHSIMGPFASFLAAEVAERQFAAQANPVAAAHAQAFSSFGGHGQPTRPCSRRRSPMPRPAPRPT